MVVEGDSPVHIDTKIFGMLIHWNGLAEGLKAVKVEAIEFIVEVLRGPLEFKSVLILI